MSPTPTNILPLRPRDHEDAARVAISWRAERHRKGWRNAFEHLLDLHWRPDGPEDGWQLDEDGMTMVSINANEWLIARGQIHARWSMSWTPRPSLKRCANAAAASAASQAC